MDYIIVFILVTLNLIFAKIMGNDQWPLFSVVFNFLVGFGLYVYLVVVERKIIDYKTNTNQKKYYLLIAIAIVIFAGIVALVNLGIIIAFFANEDDNVSKIQLVGLFVRSSFKPMINNCILFMTNVGVFLLIKKIVFRIALTLKKSNIRETTNK